VVFPGHGIHGTIPPFPLFPSDQLKNYINDVFIHYTTTKLKTTVSVAQPGGPTVTYNFAGTTAGGEFFFSDPEKTAESRFSRSTSGALSTPIKGNFASAP
jgi:hypothetical protein